MSSAFLKRNERPARWSRPHTNAGEYSRIDVIMHAGKPDKGPYKYKGGPNVWANRDAGRSPDISSRPTVGPSHVSQAAFGSTTCSTTRDRSRPNARPAIRRILTHVYWVRFR